MANSRKNKDKDFNIEIGLEKGSSWSDGKLAKIKAFAKGESGKRSSERQLTNELLSIQYQMEEYIENKETEKKDLNTFLKEYLKALNLTLKKFANSIDTTDSNLKKYLSGERTFSTDLAMKFAHFFHTTPDLWINVHVKNELEKFKENKRQTRKYEKYDYEKVLVLR